MARTHALRARTATPDGFEERVAAVLAAAEEGSVALCRQQST
jgi:hypothetical protein